MTADQLLYGRASMAKNTIDNYLEEGIEFNAVEIVVEIFPSPIPYEISDLAIDTSMDLVLMSGHLGFDQLFLPLSNFVYGTSIHKKAKFTRHEYVTWQLAKFNAQTLYFLANKTGARLAELVNEEAEFSKDPNYDPDSWLHPYGISEDDYQKGLDFVERLKHELPEQLCDLIAKAILDPETGVLSWLETAVFDEVDVIRELYQDWPVPLMIVSEGKFSTHIDPEYPTTLLREGHRLFEMHVRNYDEGDIN